MSLKDLVTQAEWNKVVKTTKISIKEKFNNNNDNDNDIDGVSLQKLQCYFRSSTLIGQMIRFLYAHEGKVSFEDFKSGISYHQKTDKQFSNNLNNGRGKKTQYGKLWIYENNMISINPSIKLHLENYKCTK